MDVVYEALARSALLGDFDRGFRDATGLSLALVRRGTSRGLARRKDNPFCALVGRTPGGRAACLRTHRDLQRRLDRTLVPQQTYCFAGLVELAVPVVVGDQHVATLVGGQAFERRPRPQQFDRVSRQVGRFTTPAARARAKCAYRSTPVLPPRRVAGALRLLRVFALQLAESANRLLVAARREDPPVVTEAKSFARAHAHRRVRLDDVAEHVHLSRFHFCRTFKDATGMTFTEFLARTRVESAKALLADPHLRVSEVSDKAGFNSVSQFNRVFRRHAGRSPSAYRASDLRAARR